MAIGGSGQGDFLIRKTNILAYNIKVKFTYKLHVNLPNFSRVIVL